MYAWIKAPVDVLITDNISHWDLYISSFDNDWYYAIVPRWYFKGYFIRAILCCSSFFLV